MLLDGQPTAGLRRRRPGRPGRARLPGSRPPDLRRPGPGRGRLRAAQPRAAGPGPGGRRRGCPEHGRPGRSRRARIRTTWASRDRKLLALASILAMGTPTVILDEPTTGQDRPGVERIQAIVASLVAARPDDRRDQPRHALRGRVVRPGRRDGAGPGHPRRDAGRGVRRGELGDARADLRRTAAGRPDRGSARPRGDADGRRPDRGAGRVSRPDPADAADPAGPDHDQQERRLDDVHAGDHRATIRGRALASSQPAPAANAATARKTKRTPRTRTPQVVARWQSARAGPAGASRRRARPTAPTRAARTIGGGVTTCVEEAAVPAEAPSQRPALQGRGRAASTGGRGQRVIRTARPRTPRRRRSARPGSRARRSPDRPPTRPARRGCTGLQDTTGPARRRSATAARGVWVWEWTIAQNASSRSSASIVSRSRSAASTR